MLLLVWIELTSSLLWHRNFKMLCIKIQTLFSFILLFKLGAVDLMIKNLGLGNENQIFHPRIMSHTVYITTISSICKMEIELYTIYNLLVI